MDHPIPIETVKHSILFQQDSVFPWENDLGHFLFIDELFRLHKALIEFYAHAVTIIHLRRNHIIFNEGQALLGFFISTQFTVGSIKPILRIQLDAHCVLCNSLPAFT